MYAYVIAHVFLVQALRQAREADQSLTEGEATLVETPSKDGGKGKSSVSSTVV